MLLGACEKFLLITFNFFTKWKARSSTASEDGGGSLFSFINTWNKQEYAYTVCIIKKAVCLFL